jgi:hypothetical protein
MKLAIGLILFVFGAFVCVCGFVMNSDTPMQVGPVPVIGGAILALAGFIMLVGLLP